MPKKTVREMNRWEKLHYSLNARVFHATVMGAAVLGLVALLIGLGLYTYSLISRYVGETDTLSRSASSIIRKVVDTESMTGEVLSIYRGLTEEERQTTGTEAYRARFAAVTAREDYRVLQTVLQEFYEAGDVDDIYLAWYDRETGALIYVCDPDEDPETRFAAGEWEPVEAEEIETFLTWDGAGKLYDISNTDRYGWMCTGGVPVKNAAGEIVCFVLADVTLGSVGAGIRSFLWQYSLAMAVTVVLVGWLMSRRMKKMLVTPINQIARAAEQYVNARLGGRTETSYFEDLNIRTGDEVENLSLVMADMERGLNDYEVNLTRITAEKERIGTELSLATRIQADMMPGIYPAFPDRSEFDIYAVMEPAREVGGDFYDFFLVDDDHLAMVMADVSGKGVPAALFMMASKIILANNTMMGRSPGKVLEATNDAICSNNREEMFVTVWLGILEISTGTVTAANAGHEYPVLRRRGSGFELLKDKHGFVIGGLDHMKYKEYSFTLSPGEDLFIYTDGLTEATDGSQNLFGTERVLEALNAEPDRSPRALLEGVHRAVDRFVGEAEQFDDLTMLCLKYLGTAGERKEDGMKELTLAATVENIEKVTEFINGHLEENGCPARARMQIDVAIDELFSNIARYAYAPGSGTATVRYRFSPETRMAQITFVDRGKAFDPLQKPDPDTKLSAEEREIGGMGIFLVKKTMDDVSYEYADGENRLTIIKRI